jgi:hypothetical protein
MAFRRDIGSVVKPELMPNGWLRVPARLTRTGVFEYMNADGSVRRELRHPDEVFHPDSLRSLEMVPSTFDHPPVPLDAKNTKQYSIGYVGDKIQVEDQKFLSATMMITDGPTVERVMARSQNETSCGYLCEVVDEAGEYEGERYDAKQTKIRYNHVAIVREGRAGPDVRLKLDGNDAVMVQGGAAKVPAQETKPMALKVIKIDGIDAEVSDTAAALIEKSNTAHAAALKEAQTVATSAAAEADKQKARADSLTAEKAKLEKSLTEATDPSKLREAVKARTDLERTATAILGEKVKVDAMDDKAIRVAIIEKVHGKLDTKDPSDAYIAAAFDLAVKQAAKEPGSALAEARKRLDTKPASRRDDDREEPNDDETPLTYEAAREKYIADSRNAWKKPLSGAEAPNR